MIVNINKCRATDIASHAKISLSSLGNQCYRPSTKNTLGIHCSIYTADRNRIRIGILLVISRRKKVVRCQSKSNILHIWIIRVGTRLIKRNSFMSVICCFYKLPSWWVINGVSICCINISLPCHIYGRCRRRCIYISPSIGCFKNYLYWSIVI